MMTIRLHIISIGLLVLSGFKTVESRQVPGHPYVEVACLVKDPNNAGFGITVDLNLASSGGTTYSGVPYLTVQPSPVSTTSCPNTNKSVRKYISGKYQYVFENFPYDANDDANEIPQCNAFGEDATNSQVFHFTLHIPQISYLYVSELDLVIHMSCEPSVQHIEKLLESTYAVSGSLDSVQGPQFGGYGSPTLTLEVLHNDGSAIDSKEVTFGTALKVRSCVTNIDAGQWTTKMFKCSAYSTTFPTFVQNFIRSTGCKEPALPASIWDPDNSFSQGEFAACREIRMNGFKFQSGDSITIKCSIRSCVREEDPTQCASSCSKRKRRAVADVKTTNSSVESDLSVKLTIGTTIQPKVQDKDNDKGTAPAQPTNDGLCFTMTQTLALGFVGLVLLLLLIIVVIVMAVKFRSLKKWQGKGPQMNSYQT